MYFDVGKVYKPVICIYLPYFIINCLQLYTYIQINQINLILIKNNLKKIITYTIIFVSII